MARSDDDGLSDVDEMEHNSLGEVRQAMATLDAVDLSEVFSVRARVLKCHVHSCVVRSCMRIALAEADFGRTEFNEVRRVSCFFFVLP